MSPVFFGDLETAAGALGGGARLMGAFSASRYENSRSISSWKTTSQGEPRGSLLIYGHIECITLQLLLVSFFFFFCIDGCVEQPRLTARMCVNRETRLLNLISSERAQKKQEQK